MTSGNDSVFSTLSNVSSYLIHRDNNSAHADLGPVVCMVWEGKDVVKTGRKMLGATNPLESDPGTIRGDFAIDVGRYIFTSKFKFLESSPTSNIL